MKIPSLLITLLAALILTGCNHSSEESIIRTQALGYIDAMSDYDFDRARPYATEETQNQTIDYFQKVLLPMMDSSALEQMRKNTPATIDIINIERVDDSTATVNYYKTTPTSPKHKDPPLKMVRRNNIWLAHVIIQPFVFTQPDTAKYDSIGKTLTQVRKIEGLRPTTEIRRPQLPNEKN